MTIKEIQDEIVDEFSMFDDWMQRYEYIIELGKNLPLIKEEFKTHEVKHKLLATIYPMLEKQTKSIIPQKFCAA